MKYQYEEWHTLQTRGGVDPAPDEQVNGTLLVGTKSVVSFSANYSSYGEDLIEIFPAFHDGKRCWVKRAVWCPSFGYNASGTDESILSFEDGVRIFLERGIFEIPPPVSQEGGNT